MCDHLRNTLQFLGSNWLAIAQVLVVIWMATIATFALNTWRRQIKAQRYIDFIDELTDTVHDFIQSMSSPVHFLKLTKIGINSYVGIHNKPQGMKNPEAVAFIENRGKSTAENFLEYLDTIKPIVSKMNSLVAKGQVFRIENYFQCQDACMRLIWSHNQIEAFTMMMSTPDLAWNNPDIQQSLDKVLSIDSEQIESNLIEQNSKFLLFARQAYSKILK